MLEPASALPRSSRLAGALRAGIGSVKVRAVFDPRPWFAPSAGPSRRGARVVDRGGLENRCACKRTVGSNPTLSATFSSKPFAIHTRTVGAPKLKKRPVFPPADLFRE